MRQRITNHSCVQLRDHLGNGISMYGCTDIKLLIEQDDSEYQFDCVIDSMDPSIVHVEIPKLTAMQFRRKMAKYQIALTLPNGHPWATDPEEIRIGALLRKDGYK